MKAVAKLLGFYITTSIAFLAILAMLMVIGGKWPLALAPAVSISIALLVVTGGAMYASMTLLRRL